MRQVNGRDISTIGAILRTKECTTGSSNGCSGTFAGTGTGATERVATLLRRFTQLLASTAVVEPGRLADREARVVVVSTKTNA